MISLISVFEILTSFAETNNIINVENGGYEHVSDYIPIAHPNASTLAKLQALEPSTVSGDRTREPPSKNVPI